MVPVRVWRVLALGFLVFGCTEAGFESRVFIKTDSARDDRPRME